MTDTPGVTSTQTLKRRLALFAAATTTMLAPMLTTQGTPAASAATSIGNIIAPTAVATPGTRVNAVGVVPGVGRPVVLQSWVAGRWVNKRSGKTDTSGRFAIPVPTWWIGNHAWRVVAPASAGRAAVISPKDALRVNPGYTAAGSGGDFARFPGNPRFSSCQTPVIRFKVNVDEAPANKRAAIITLAKQAATMTSQATGYPIAYTGTTSQRPNFSTGFYDATRWPAGTELVIRWASNKEVGSGVAGTGGPHVVLTQQGPYRIVRGLVLMNKSMDWRYDFGFYGAGNGMRHEIGHALGLDHADAKSQVLYPVLYKTGGQWGAGDLAGMRSVGAEQGCLTDSQGGAGARRVPYRVTAH